MRLTDWIIIGLAGTAFGASFGLNEILLRELGPLSISALRVGIAAIGCWAWMLLRAPEALRVGRSGARLTVLGFFQFALPFALLPFAQMHITSSVAGIANALTPVATLIVSYLLVTGERVNVATALGLAFGALGAIVLVSGNGAGTGSDPLFVALAVLVTFSYAIALNIAKTLTGIKATAAITWALTAGFILMAPVAIWLEGIPTTVNMTTAFSIFVLGLGLTAIPFMVLYTMMARVGAINVSLVTFIAPLSALAIGVFLFDEVLSAANVAGVLLVLFGLLCIDGRAKLPRLPKRLLSSPWVNKVS